MSDLGIIGSQRWRFLGEVSRVVEETYDSPADAVFFPVMFAALGFGAVKFGMKLMAGDAHIAELAGGGLLLLFAGLCFYGFMVHVGATAVYATQPTEVDRREVWES